MSILAQPRVVDKWNYDETQSLIGMLGSNSEEDIYLALGLINNNRYKFFLRVLTSDIIVALHGADRILSSKTQYRWIRYHNITTGVRNVNPYTGEINDKEIRVHREIVSTLLKRITHQEKEIRKTRQQWESKKRMYKRSAKAHYS